MDSAFSTAIPDPSLAAIGQLSENSRLGFASRNPALHRGIEWSKSTLALGLPEWSGKTASGPAVAANNGTIRPLKGQEYDDALNAYCSARGRAKFIADWLPGGGTIARDLWNSPTGAALGFYQLPTADINNITAENSGGQTVAMHATSEGLNAAAGSTAFLYAMRAQTGVPMTVGSKILSGAATIVLVVDAGIGFVKEGQEILNCQAGH